MKVLPMTNERRNYLARLQTAARYIRDEGSQLPEPQGQRNLDYAYARGFILQERAKVALKRGGETI